jgi:hypothetical protein
MKNFEEHTPNLANDTEQAIGMLFNISQIAAGKNKGYLIDLPILGTLRHINPSIFRSTSLSFDQQILKTPLNTLSYGEGDLFITRYIPGKGTVSVDIDSNPPTREPVVRTVTADLYKGDGVTKHMEVAGNAAQHIGSQVLSRVLNDVQSQLMPTLSTDK